MTPPLSSTNRSAFTLIELILAVGLSAIIILAAYAGLDGALRVVRSANDRWETAQWHHAIWRSAVDEADRRPPGSGSRLTLTTPFSNTPSSHPGYTVVAPGSDYAHAVAQLRFAVDAHLEIDHGRSGGTLLYWDGDRSVTPMGTPSAAYPAGGPRSSYDQVYPPHPTSEGWPTAAQQTAATGKTGQPMPTTRSQPSIGAFLGSEGRAWVPYQPGPDIADGQTTRWICNIRVAGGGVQAVPPRLAIDTGSSFTPRAMQVLVQPMSPIGRDELWNQSGIGVGMTLARDLAPVGDRLNGQFSAALVPSQAFSSGSSRHLTMSETWPLVMAVTGAR